MQRALPQVALPQVEQSQLRQLCQLHLHLFLGAKVAKLKSFEREIGIQF
jgi:hypothetical protein